LLKSFIQATTKSHIVCDHCCLHWTGAESPSTFKG